MTRITSNKENIPTQYFKDLFTSKMAAISEDVGAIAKSIFNICRHPLFSFLTVGSFANAYIPLNEPYRFLASSLVGYSCTAFMEELKSGKITIKWINQAEKPQTINLSPTEVVEQSSVVEITDANFKAEVLESKMPVILDAYSTRCYPCQKIAPIFNELSNEYIGKIKFAKFNVNLNDSLMRELDIDLMPTFLIFKNGENVGRQIGVPSFDKNEFDVKLVKPLL